MNQFTTHLALVIASATAISCQANKPQSSQENVVKSCDEFLERINYDLYSQGDLNQKTRFEIPSSYNVRIGYRPKNIRLEKRENKKTVGLRISPIRLSNFLPIEQHFHRKFLNRKKTTNYTSDITSIYLKFFPDWEKNILKNGSDYNYSNAKFSTMEAFVQANNSTNFGLLRIDHNGWSPHERYSLIENDRIILSIDCINNSPRPKQCAHEFVSSGVLVRFNYEGKHLSRWHEIQSNAENFIECISPTVR